MTGQAGARPINFSKLSKILRPARSIAFRKYPARPITIFDRPGPRPARTTGPLQALCFFNNFLFLACFCDHGG